MPSSLLVDAIAKPTEVLLELSRVPGDADRFPERVAAHFAAIFAPERAFNEITVLDARTPLQSLRPRSLVRFDGMVQDTAHSPEVYLSRRSNGECGGWGLNDSDVDDDQAPVDYSLLRECSIVWAVSIPGQTAWCSPEVGVLNLIPVPSFLPHKYPLSSSPHLGAQIKIYDNALAESLRTTDLYSFVGILTSDPWHSSIEISRPPSVPTIHVLFSLKIPPTVLPRRFPDPSFGAPLLTVREQLVSWIAEEALGGDLLAAELVLLTVLGRVQSRAPPILPLSLTLSGYGPTQSQTPKLIQVLSQLVPILTVVPLSLTVLNTTSFVPQSKDEDLHSGWMQLPRATVCIISELVLEEGTISEQGLLNLKAIQDTITNQMVDYIFPFSRFSFETDITFLVLAAGPRSLFFKTQLELPIRGREDCPLYVTDASAIRLPAAQMLNEFRKLIGGAKVANTTLDETTAAFIQEDFVRERQAASSRKREVVTSDDLITRMMEAKLIAASLHEPEVTSATWERAKALDVERKARIL